MDESTAIKEDVRLTCIRHDATAHSAHADDRHVSASPTSALADEIFHPVCMASIHGTGDIKGPIQLNPYSDAQVRSHLSTWPVLTNEGNDRPE